MIHMFIKYIKYDGLVIYLKKKTSMIEYIFYPGDTIKTTEINKDNIFYILWSWNETSKFIMNNFGINELDEKNLIKYSWKKIQFNILTSTTIDDFCQMGFIKVSNAFNIDKDINMITQYNSYGNSSWTSKNINYNLLNNSIVGNICCSLLNMNPEILPNIGQVATMNPSPLEDERKFVPGIIPREDAHIDGLPTKSNGRPQGQINNFSLLVGVALDDIGSEIGGGNLGILPGSHDILGKISQTYSDKEIIALLGDVNKGEPYERLKNFFGNKNWADLLNYCPPTPLCLKKGDAVILQYNLIHFVYPNLTTMPRKMLYYRITDPNRIGGEINFETLRFPLSNMRIHNAIL